MNFLLKNGKDLTRNFFEVYISFSTKNRVKQITQQKSKPHISLNELSTSESAGLLLKTKNIFQKKTCKFLKLDIFQGQFFQNIGATRNTTKA